MARMAEQGDTACVDLGCVCQHIDDRRKTIAPSGQRARRGRDAHAGHRVHDGLAFLIAVGDEFICLPGRIAIAMVEILTDGDKGDELAEHRGHEARHPVMIGAITAIRRGERFIRESPAIAGKGLADDEGHRATGLWQGEGEVEVARAIARANADHEFFEGAAPPVQGVIDHAAANELHRLPLWPRAVDGLVEKLDQRVAPRLPFVQRLRGDDGSRLRLVGGFEARIVQPQHRAIGEHQEEDETGDDPDGPAGDFDDQCHGASLFGSALAAACGH